VQKHFTCVVDLAQAVKPIAENGVGIRVVAAKQGVVHLGAPDLPLVRLPAAQKFGAADDGVRARGAAVGDAPAAVQAAAAGADPFPVNTLADLNGVAGHGAL